MAENNAEYKDPYKKSFGEIVVYVIKIFAMISVTLLTFRFFLELFGANPNSAFTAWIYNSSDIVLQPFRGIFNVHSVDENTGSFLDVAVLFAIVVYLMLSYWMTSLIESWENKRLTDYKRQKALDASKSHSSSSQHNK